jgi:hypothetical protein
MHALCRLTYVASHDVRDGDPGENVHGRPAVGRRLHATQDQA